MKRSKKHFKTSMVLLLNSLPELLGEWILLVSVGYSAIHIQGLRRVSTWSSFFEPSVHSELQLRPLWSPWQVEKIYFIYFFIYLCLNIDTYIKGGLLATNRLKEKLTWKIINNRMNLINSTSDGITCLSLLTSQTFRNWTWMRKLTVAKYVLFRASATHVICHEVSFPSHFFWQCVICHEVSFLSGFLWRLNIFNGDILQLKVATTFWRSELGALVYSS